MKIEPIAGSKNRVFIEVKPIEHKTSTGIILMEDPEKAPTEGVVYAVSQRDDTGMTPIVQEGDYVYFPENAPTPITIEGKEFLVLKEGMIYARRID